MISHLALCVSRFLSPPNFSFLRSPVPPATLRLTLHFFPLRLPSPSPPPLPSLRFTLPLPRPSRPSGVLWFLSRRATVYQGCRSPAEPQPHRQEQAALRGLRGREVKKAKQWPLFKVWEEILWMDLRTVNSNEHWFLMVSKWCEMDFVHTRVFLGIRAQVARGQHLPSFAVPRIRRTTEPMRSCAARMELAGGICGTGFVWFRALHFLVNFAGAAIKEPLARRTVTKRDFCDLEAVKVHAGMAGKWLHERLLRFCSHIFTIGDRWFGGHV